MYVLYSGECHLYPLGFPTYASSILLHKPSSSPRASLGVKIYFFVTPLKTELPCQLWLRVWEHFSKGKRQPSTGGFLPASLRTQLLIWSAQTPFLSAAHASGIPH